MNFGCPGKIIPNEGQVLNKKKIIAKTNQTINSRMLLVGKKICKGNQILDIAEEAFPSNNKTWEMLYEEKETRNSAKKGNESF